MLNVCTLCYNNWMCVNYAYLLVLMYSFFSEIVWKFCRMVCGDMSFTFFVALALHGAGAPLPLLFPPLSIHFVTFCSFLLFPFLIGFTCFLLLSIPSHSTRIVPLRFQVGGRRKRPNLGLVCCVYFVLSVLPVLSSGFFLMFCCIWFSLILRCDSCLPLL